MRSTPHEVIANVYEFFSAVRHWDHERLTWLSYRAHHPDDAELVAAMRVQPATGQFSKAELSQILPELNRKVEGAWAYVEQLRNFLLKAAQQYGIRTRYLCLLDEDCLRHALAEAQCLEQVARNDLAEMPSPKADASAQNLPPLKEVRIEQYNASASETGVASTARTFQKKEIQDLLAITKSRFAELKKQGAIIARNRQSFAFDLNKFNEPDRQKIEAKLSERKPGCN